MSRKIRFLALVFALIVAGCQSYLKPVRIGSTAVPEQTYQVTVHETSPLYYAVLFDIPDDGKPVVMLHTYATTRVGTDVPGPYIDYLNTSIRNYRTLQIDDREGTVRGYLLISNQLDYFVMEREKEGRIVVHISDPNLGDGARRFP